jgi:seryl-tRNA synthetase
VENGQRDDGTILVPQALRSFGAPETIAAAG